MPNHYQHLFFIYGSVSEPEQHWGLLGLVPRRINQANISLTMFERLSKARVQSIKKINKKKISIHSSLGRNGDKSRQAQLKIWDWMSAHIYPHSTVSLAHTALLLQAGCYKPLHAARLSVANHCMLPVAFWSNQDGQTWMPPYLSNPPGLFPLSEWKLKYGWYAYDNEGNPDPELRPFLLLVAHKNATEFRRQHKSCVLDGSISVGPRRPQIDKSTRDGVKRSITKLSDIYARPVV